MEIPHSSEVSRRVFLSSMQFRYEAHTERLFRVLEVTDSEVGRKDFFAVAAEKTLGAVFADAVFYHMAAAAVDASMIRRDSCLNQERLQMTVCHAEVIGYHGVKSSLIAERQLFIGNNDIF